jgi:hypothetical protein
MIGQSKKVVWAGGEHDFLYDIGHLRALEQRLDAGVAPILLRLLNGSWKVDDVLETIRLGLQGGGMPEREAVRVIEKSYNGANLYELSVVATRVLSMFIAWPTGPGEDEPEKEDDKGEAKTPTSRSETGGPAGPDLSASLQ